MDQKQERLDNKAGFSSGRPFRYHIFTYGCQMNTANSGRGLLFLSGAGRLLLGHMGSKASAVVVEQPALVPGTWALMLARKQ